MTREVIGSHNIDARRVYIAGMSAGGAMAAIVAATYPDLYAAVGIHSGVPYGAAQNFLAAITAMKDGAATGTPLPSQGIPLIVFHGDQDIMVNSRNAAQLWPDPGHLIGASQRGQWPRLHTHALSR